MQTIYLNVVSFVYEQLWCERAKLLKVCDNSDGVGAKGED